MKKHNINWNSIDWNQPDTVIGAQLGVTPSLVGYYRKQTHLRKFKREKYRIDWASVDWTKPDHQIAKECNVTAPPVCNARRRYAPDHLKNASPSPQGLKRYQRKLDAERAERAAKEMEAMRNAAVIYTADQIQRDAQRDTLSASMQRRTELWSKVDSAPMTPAPSQPSWVKRKLIALRDWLFNLCVSVEKEANK